MSNYAISLKRLSILLAAIAFTAVLLAANFSSLFSAKANAAQLGNRSLTLSSTLAGTETGDNVAGSPTNGSDVEYTFQFTHPSAEQILAFEFEFCTEAIGACTMPAGMDADSATIVLQEDDNVAFTNSYTVDGAHTTTGVVGISHATGNAVGANSVIEITLGSIQNPNVIDDFYVRITSFLDDDWGAGDVVDEGTVASAITEGIFITSRVKETLGFSTTAEVDDTNVGDPGAACAPVTGTGALQIGDPVDNSLSISTAYYGESAFRVYTNAANGVSIQYEGETLTKGTDDIDAIGGGTGVETASAVGVEQFGLAIDTTVDAGNAGDYEFVSTAADLTGGDPGELSLDVQYDNGGGDAFAFLTGGPDEIASSAQSYVNCSTAVVRYVANISPLTPAGTYTTTIVYSAVPEY